MNGPVYIFTMLKMSVVSVLVLAGLMIYRTRKRRIPVRNAWCRRYFPLIGFVMIVSGLIVFIVAIALSDRMNFVVDLGLAVFLGGLTPIGLVAKKSKGGGTGSDFGPSL
ncbi:MAG: hypothetical protein EPN93_06325 [Spirochaetes bacterium]|nr:MAG: hypothetical protein EPN93_06325 [Spirochaetota bacterium]